MPASARRETRFLFKSLLQVAVIATVISVGAAFAQAVTQTATFGSRTLNMPPPEGYVALAKTAPAYIDAAQGYLPPTNRLVDSYALPDAAATLSSGKTATLDRYFQLQTMRKVEGVPLSADDFKGASSEIEASFDKALKEVDVDKLTKNGNAQMKDMTSTDPKVALSGIESQGVYRREPWGIFFTVKSRVAMGASGEASDLICAGALTLINHQLMYLNGYAHMTSDADRVWVQNAVSAWADAVHAANPDDPAVAARAKPLGSGFNWTELRHSLWFGAAAGALVGILIALFRRRSK